MINQLMSDPFIRTVLWLVGIISSARWRWTSSMAALMERTGQLPMMVMQRRPDHKGCERDVK